MFQQKLLYILTSVWVPSSPIGLHYTCFNFFDSVTTDNTPLYENKQNEREIVQWRLLPCTDSLALLVNQIPNLTQLKNMHWRHTILLLLIKIFNKKFKQNEYVTCLDLHQTCFALFYFLKSSFHEILLLIEKNFVINIQSSILT